MAHITLIVAAGPDGVRGNHFRNEKQDIICIELSVLSSRSLCCGLAKWIFNDAILILVCKYRM